MVPKYSRIIKSFLFFNVVCVYLFIKKTPNIFEVIVIVNISLILYLFLIKKGKF
jgi:hypothetical protein